MQIFWVKNSLVLKTNQGNARYIKSEVAASRSEVWACAQVKYCTEGAK